MLEAEAPAPAAGGVDPGALAASAAVLLAVAPRALGGAILRASAHEDAAAWLGALASLLPEGTPMLRLPLGVTDDRLLGGLDLSATLSLGRPVAEAGLLTRADGGLLVAPGAERLPPRVVAPLTSALDHGEVALQRDGLSALLPARLALVAIDEGTDDEVVPRPLRERLACWLALPPRWRPDEWPLPDREDIIAARARLADVVDVDGQAAEALTATAVALGIASLRAPVQALAGARAAGGVGG
jgi:magnesium chelatase subunit D